jgi:hypothetical protein
MSIAQELAQFHRFVSEQLAGNAQVTPEEVLDLWREQYPAVNQSAEDLEAIRQAVSDMESGDTGEPIAKFDRRLRAAHFRDVTS